MRNTDIDWISLVSNFFNFFETLEIVLIYMVKILIMSGKMTPLGLFAERSYWHHIFFIWRHQKVYGMNQILLGMLSCEQSLLTIEKFGHSIITSSVWGFEQNNTLFERWFWFSFNNLGLALRMTLNLYKRLANLNF